MACSNDIAQLASLARILIKSAYFLLLLTLEVIPIHMRVACVDLSLHGRYLEKVARSALFLSHTSYHFHLFPSNVKSRIDLLSPK